MRGEFFETLGSARACGTLRRSRHWWRDRQIEAGMKRDGFADDCEVAIKLLQPTAHRGQAAYDGGDVIDVTVRAKEAIESGFDQYRFCNTGTSGGSFQPRRRLFRKMDANQRFHGQNSLPGLITCDAME